MIDGGHLRALARAICRANLIDFGHSGAFLEDSIELQSFEWNNEARAAIEAMRKPTTPMCMAGLKAAYNEDPGEMWPAMIDEALK